MSEFILTVSDLNRQIKRTLESNPDFRFVYVRGEISNFIRHSNGHFYFALKDQKSKIKAIMFASYASKVKFNLENGQQVKVYGTLNVYESDGSYQINCLSISLDGLGEYYLEFESLKKKLFEAGLFEESRKIPLPKYPMKIGIISALKGAAIQDIIATIKRRWPVASLILFPSLVQGTSASKDLIKKFKSADELNLDLIIFARGGGSYEDLIAFNDEKLALAVTGAKTATISAIGHEIDYTILDFICSLRAPTPTAAAEIATPNIIEVFKYLDYLKVKLNNLMENIYQRYLTAFNYYKNSYILSSPNNITEIYQQKIAEQMSKITLLYQMKVDKSYSKLDILNRSLINSIKNYFDNLKNKFIELKIKLSALDSNKMFERGYILVTKNDKIISSVNDLKLNDSLLLNFKDGNAKTIVVEKRGKENGK